MIKYRIIYIGDNSYMAWDNANGHFVPAYMHLYVSTWDNIDDVFPVMRKVKKLCPSFADNIYIDFVPRDPLGENRPEVKQYF